MFGASEVKFVRMSSPSTSADGPANAKGAAERNSVLTDSFDRHHNYLRISLTDRCNLRCLYCMPGEEQNFTPGSGLMNAEEIAGIAKVFVDYGVDKIRLTGGEPLVRKDFTEILQGLKPLGVEMAMTTNAVLVDRYFDLLEDSGIRTINVSLDTLKPDRFFWIAKRDHFERVMQNIGELVRRGFKVKVNAVSMRDFNEDEIEDFVAWSAREPIDIRFIEFMPFDGNRWAMDKVYSYGELMDRVKGKFELEKLTDGPNDTSRTWKVIGGAGSFGMIASMTAPFCDTCNRIRLTADGRLRNCLFSDAETDLLTPWRQHVAEGLDPVSFIRPLIAENLQAKHARHGGMPQIEEIAEEVITRRSMIRIGG